MNKLLIICILIVSLVLISGCTNEEKTANVQSSIESQSPEHDIDPTTLLKGYESSQYMTFSANEMNSVLYDFSSYFMKPKGTIYEGPLPSGQKHTGTRFRLSNADTKVSIVVMIGDSDSDSKFEDSFHGNLNGEGNNNVKNTFDQIETNVVGDYSFMCSAHEDGQSLHVLCFSHENQIVSIYSIGAEQNMNQCQTDMLKVAKKIKRQLD